MQAQLCSVRCLHFGRINLENDSTSIRYVRGNHLSQVCEFLSFCLHKKKGKAIPLHAMEALGGERRYSSYSFTTSAVDGGEWSVSRPGRAFTPGERTPGTHWTGAWVDPRAGLNTEDRGKILLPLPGIEPLSPGRPARSQTLYYLS
jgi:hypothetical protein